MPRLASTAFALAAMTALLVACSPTQELTPDEIAFQQKAQKNELVNQTVRKPGERRYEKGKSGACGTIR